MNCPNCHHEIPANSAFCLSCGLIFIGYAADVTGIQSNTESTSVRQTDPLLGRTLDGKYRLLESLGKGGMGTVYRARRLHIDDEVAVKVLQGYGDAGDDTLARFRIEAHAAASLHHPNVVAIYDYNEVRDEALAYIVMELIPGVTLRHLLKENRRLPLDRALMLMEGICAGVEAAHKRRIVHRDLKPDNIMLTPAVDQEARETVKVVDFGIAKLRDSASASALTQSGMMVGSPFYMSPEQCRGDELDSRSDVYSLGIMFYEMISGARPFNAPTPTGVISKHLCEPPPRLPRDLQVPSRVDGVLMKALAKDPKSRQADARSFIQELSEAAAGGRALPADRLSLPGLKEMGHRKVEKVSAGKTPNAILVAAMILAVVMPGSYRVYRAAQPSKVITQRAETIPQSPLAAGSPSRQASPIVRRAESPVAGRKGNHSSARKATAAINQIPVKAISRTIPSVIGSDMPPEIRRMLNEALQGRITMRQADGKVTTISLRPAGN